VSVFALNWIANVAAAVGVVALFVFFVGPRE
jgi:hypothetical protein